MFQRLTTSTLDLKLVQKAPQKDSRISSQHIVLQWVGNAISQRVPDRPGSLAIHAGRNHEISPASSPFIAMGLSQGADIFLTWAPPEMDPTGVA
jgi:hypothetical protein